MTAAAAINHPLISLARMVIASEILDYTLQDALFALLPGNRTERVTLHSFATGSILLGEKSLEEKIRLLREFSRLFLDQRKFSRMCRLLQRADTARGIRNKRVHAIWTNIRQEGADIVARITGAEEISAMGPLRDAENATADQLHREANQISSIALDLAKFCRENELTVLSWLDRSS